MLARERNAECELCMCEGCVYVCVIGLVEPVRRCLYRSSDSPQRLLCAGAVLSCSTPDALRGHRLPGRQREGRDGRTRPDSVMHLQISARASVGFSSSDPLQLPSSMSFLCVSVRLPAFLPLRSLNGCCCQHTCVACSESP